MSNNRQPLSVGNDWTFDLIDQYFHEIERIAKEKYNLDYFPNQIEIISSEQMLDAYAANGMPINYHHWSFGKQFIRDMKLYQGGRMGLAYEIVINSNPCISYLMEENTLMMQVLVMAHACFGHNHFFKNNYLFQEWTSPDAIIEYLRFAKNYITKCEERYGVDAVEEIIDSCHALRYHGVDKHKKPPRLSAAEEEKQRDARERYIQSQINELWDTIPGFEQQGRRRKKEKLESRFPPAPVENILYFVEKNAPRLQEWQREIVRIVRKVSQYFYPQIQTKLMNEGFATFMHYHLVYDLHDEGLITDGHMLEFLQNHTNVVKQPAYNERGGGSINPYALGFAMFMDIKRICMDPTEEDRKWFPEFAGNNDWLSTVKWAVENFKDDSFVLQFLSPKVMRDFRLFAITDNEDDPKLEVSAIHNTQGYRILREKLATKYNHSSMIPDIQATYVDRWGDRSLTLTHYMTSRRPLDADSVMDTLTHVYRLWGYPIKLNSVYDNMVYNTYLCGPDGESLISIFDDDDEEKDDDDTW